MKLLIFLFACSVYSSNPLPLDSNVISYYNFDDIEWSWPGIGTEYDVVNPSYQMRISNSYTRGTGFVGNGLVFDTSNSGGYTYDAIPFSYGAYTIEVLIKWDNASDFSGVIYSPASILGEPVSGYHWGFDKGCMYLGESSDPVVITPKYQFEYNTWYYLTYTFGFAYRPDSVKDGQVKLYINGIEIYSEFGVNLVGKSTSFILGVSLHGGEVYPPIMGTLDEFRISNIARSDSAVAAIWDAINGTTNTETTLVPQTKLILVYPNPFDRSSNILFDTDGKRSSVSVYDLTGRVVRQLNSSCLIWDGNNSYGEPVASGTYLYQILGEITQKGKIILR